MTIMHRHRGGTGHLSRPRKCSCSSERSNRADRRASFCKWMSGWCTVLSILLCSLQLCADVHIPEELLNEAGIASAGSAEGINNDHHHHPTAINECGGRCSCLGEYMDCANVHMVRFDEHLPEWITTLDLSHNELVDNIDQFVGNASGLTELKLRTNSLQKFPVFRGLGGLKTLQLSYNRIEVISPEALLALPALVSLDLNKNLIKVVLPNSFPTSNRLRNVNLNHNRIETLDEFSLMHLKHLVELRLGQNKLRTIPVGLFRGMKKLRRMELNDNQIAELTYKMFANLTNLRQLRLRGNQLRALPTGVFHGLSNLNLLELDNNQLTDVQKNGFFNLSTLTTISLSNNSIATIATNAWEFCQLLESIDLSNNRLTNVTTQTFECLDRLTTLNLSYNQIGIITEGAFNCTTNLDVLDLNANRVSYVVEDMNGPFNALHKLTRLYLGDNRIKSVNRNAFLGLTQLNHLNLSANNITSIQTDAFARLTHLQTFSLNTSSLLCDCNLLQFHGWLRSIGRGLVDVHVSCSYPAAIRGRPLQSLNNATFTCNETPKPRIIEEPPAQLLAIRERNATLTCSATSSAANAPMQLKWKRDMVELTAAGVLVERESSVLPNTNSTLATARLRLINVDDTHAGRYQCVVSNAYGTTYSQKVRVTVASFPKFRKIPSNLTINATSTARLDCAATGEPTPQISWEKDGGDDFPAARERRMHVMTADDAFFIVNAKSADQGVYTCMAVNAAGSITANTTLTVHEPPTFARPMENREVAAGKSSVIECRALGSPKPSLVWRRRQDVGSDIGADGQVAGTPIVVTERHFFAGGGQLLVIVDAEPADAGTYSCTIANALGSKTGTMQLKVLSPAAAAAAAAGSKGLKAEEITGLVIITIVCCAVATSVIWVVIIYQTRNRRGCCIGFGTGTGTGGGGNSSSNGSANNSARPTASGPSGLKGAGGVGGTGIVMPIGIGASVPDSLNATTLTTLTNADEQHHLHRHHQHNHHHHHHHHGAALLLNGSGGSGSLSRSAAAGRYESESLLSSFGGSRRHSPQIVPMTQQQQLHHLCSDDATGMAASTSVLAKLATQPYYDDVSSFKDSGRGDSTRRSIANSPQHTGSDPDVCCIELSSDALDQNHRNQRKSPPSVVSYRPSPTSVSTTATTTPSTEEADAVNNIATVTHAATADATAKRPLSTSSSHASLGRVHIQANRLSDLLLQQQRPGALRCSPPQPPTIPSTMTTHNTSSSSTRANSSSLSDSIPQVPSAMMLLASAPLATAEQTTQ